MVRIDFNRLRFLLVDDNAHMRRIVRTLLNSYGARDILEAEDGAATLAWAADLPGSDGRVATYGWGFWQR